MRSNLRKFLHCVSLSQKSYSIPMKHPNGRIEHFLCYRIPNYSTGYATQFICFFFYSCIFGLQRSKEALEELHVVNYACHCQCSLSKSARYCVRLCVSSSVQCRSSRHACKAHAARSRLAEQSFASALSAACTFVYLQLASYVSVAIDVLKCVASYSPLYAPLRP